MYVVLSRVIAVFSAFAVASSSFSIHVTLLLVFFWIMLINALPTIAASAPAFIIFCMCSGWEMPKPTASGIFLSVIVLTCCTSLIVESSRVVFVPVVP